MDTVTKEKIRFFGAAALVALIAMGFGAEFPAAVVGGLTSSSFMMYLRVRRSRIEREHKEGQS
jgi:hypothetical protein